MYNGSPIRMITSVLNDYKWLPWKFSSANKRFWSEKDVQLQFMNWLAGELNIKTMEDWNNVTNGQVIERGGKVLLSIYNNNLAECLKAVYPHEYNLHKVGKLSLQQLNDIHNSKILTILHIESDFNHLSFQYQFHYYSFFEF